MAVQGDEIRSGANWAAEGTGFEHSSMNSTPFWAGQGTDLGLDSVIRPAEKLLFVCQDASKLRSLSCSNFTELTCGRAG